MTVLKKSLLFLTKNRIDFFEEGGSNIFHIELSPQSVSDLEIVNSDVMKQEIVTFLATNKIIPSRALIILSEEILFQKDFPPKTKEEDPDPETLIKNYVENIPFADTVSKTIDLQGGAKRVIAANKDFYGTVQSLFEKNKFTVQSVVLSLEIPGFQGNSLTPEGIDRALKHFDSYKIGSFDEIKKTAKKDSESVEEDMSYETPEDNSLEQKKQEKKRQALLLGVFGVLILILIGVSIKTFVLDSDTTPPAASPQNVQTPTYEPSPTPQSQQILPSPTLEQIQSTSIQIQNTVQASQQRDELQSILTNAGFENVNFDTTPQQTTTNTIVFSSELSEELKSFITQEVQKIYPTISVREATGTSFDTVITLIN